MGKLAGHTGTGAAKSFCVKPAAAEQGVTASAHVYDAADQEAATMLQGVFSDLNK